MSPFPFPPLYWLKRNCKARDCIQWSLIDHKYDLDNDDENGYLSTIRDQR